MANLLKGLSENNTDNDKSKIPERLDPAFHFKFTLHNAFEAIQWLKKEIQSLKIVSNKQTLAYKVEEKNLLAGDTDKADKFEVGKMYLFHYDPKGRKTLPYYDTFPLILVTGIYKGGFTGLNLHYLPPEPRLILLSNLMQKIVFRNGELDRLNIKYENLKGVQEFAFFEPCFKQYLKSNIRSTIKLIPPEEWGFAASLPIEAFVKKPKQYVWKESMATQDMTL
jgi:hypothetical protein